MEKVGQIIKLRREKNRTSQIDFQTGKTIRKDSGLKTKTTKGGNQKIRDKTIKDDIRNKKVDERNLN